MEMQQVIQSIVEAMPLATMVCDQDKKIYYINPAAEDLTGWSQNKALLRSCNEVFGLSNEDSPASLAVCRLTDDKDSVLEEVIDLKQKNGDYKKVRAIFSRLADSSNGTGILILLEDITEQEKSKNRMELLSQIVEQCSEGMAATDLSGKLLFANQAFAAMHQYEPDELSGKHVSVFHQPDQWRSAQAAYQQLKATGEFKGEVWHTRRDGSAFPTFMHNAFLRDGNGKAYGVIGAARDISESKNTEQALQKSQQRMRAILNALPDFLFRINRDGIFLDYHTPDSTQLALPAEEFLGKRVHDVLPSHFVQKAMGTMNAAFESRQVVTFEYQLKVPSSNGTRRKYEARVVAINQKEALYIARDVTDKKRKAYERRRLEAQIQHAQKLESLGVLAGGIAHDFNNLLTGVLGNLDLAMVNLSPESPAQPLVDKARDTALHLATLTDQMLAYSGRGKFVVQSLNLSRLVEEMQHLLQISVAKNVVLRYDLSENLPNIAADASQIRQVIMNLVINASEAVGEKSGIVSIATGLMKAEPEYLCETYLNENLPGGYYVYLEVSDTGVGMDTPTQQKVFDPFFSTKFTGRGLGLAAVLGIVRGHRGAAKIYSEIGKGTTFKVLFPVSDSDTPAIQSEQQSQPEIIMRSGTVLVVDDEETVRAVAKMILERVGFNVLTANDGKEAIQIFNKHQHEIVIVVLDLHMPRKAGEETYREMRTLRPDIPVVLSSGYNERDATINFAGKGLAGFVKKPYKIDDLLQKIYDALDSKPTVG